MFLLQWKKTVNLGFFFCVQFWKLEGKNAFECEEFKFNFYLKKNEIRDFYADNMGYILFNYLFILNYIPYVSIFLEWKK